MNTSHPDGQTIRIVSMQTVLDLIGMSRSSLHGLLKSGKFPKAITVTGRHPGFIADEVDAWLAHRKTFTASKARSPSRSKSPISGGKNE